MKKKFIITVDTEGDNLWKERGTQHETKEVKTENAKYLERFQILCEKYSFVPTYLTNYEMSKAVPFVELARHALRKRQAEIGMHIHAWNSPPIASLAYSLKGRHAYIGEYDKKLQWKKIEYMTRQLEDVFQVPITSHRSGRWWFDEFSLKCLKKLGYLVDCSMTPYVSWEGCIGNRLYGIDYSKDRYRGEFMLSEKNIHREGDTGIYEVPPTILKHYTYSFPKIKQSVEWLRPNGNNLEGMLWVKEKVRKHPKLGYVQFMIHSSELMAGGSPTFRSKSSIEKLYKDLEILFCEISKNFEGVGLTDYIIQKYM